MNPYDSSNTSCRRAEPGAWHGLVVGTTAFVAVLAVAALAGSVGPTVAHIAGAPREFTMSILQVSMAACLPFGVALAYFAYRCARRQIAVVRLCWFFLVLLVIIPLVMHPTTAGPLVEYTGAAMVVTIVAALIAGGTLRRFTPTAILDR